MVPFVPNISEQLGKRVTTREVVGLLSHLDSLASQPRRSDPRQTERHRRSVLVPSSKARGPDRSVLAPSSDARSP